MPMKTAILTILKSEVLYLSRNSENSLYFPLDMLLTFFEEVTIVSFMDIPNLF